MVEKASGIQKRSSPVSVAELRAWIATLDTQMDLNRLHDRTSFRQAGADSFDLFTLIIGLQDAFGITIPDGEIAKVDSLEAMARYLNEHLL